MNEKKLPEGKQYRRWDKYETLDELILGENFD
jgi:hypothetical protein